MLQQFFLARIIPSDIYYRRLPTPVGPTEVEATEDSIVVAVPVAATTVAEFDDHKVTAIPEVEKLQHFNLRRRRVYIVRY